MIISDTAHCFLNMFNCFVLNYSAKYICATIKYIYSAPLSWFTCSAGLKFKYLFWCWNIFNKCVSIIIYAHILSSEKKFILCSCAHIFFYSHFINLCTSWHFHYAFFYSKLHIKMGGLNHSNELIISMQDKHRRFHCGQDTAYRNNQQWNRHTKIKTTRKTSLMSEIFPNR